MYACMCMRVVLNERACFFFGLHRGPKASYSFKAHGPCLVAENCNPSSLNTSSSSSRLPKSSRIFCVEPILFPWKISTFLHLHCHQQMDINLPAHLLESPPASLSFKTYITQSSIPKEKKSRCSWGLIRATHTSLAHRQSLIACKVSSTPA